MTLRVFAGGLVTETNAFSPILTSLSDYAVATAGASEETYRQILGGTVFGRFAQVANAERSRYIQGSYASAQPSGTTTRAAYETLRDTLLSEVEDALPLDCVLLLLHGAMVADGYVDCETDIVQRVRQLVGSGAKIGVLLDLHCDLPEALLEPVDVVITLKEYPHTDIDERAEEVARLTLDAALGRVSPKVDVFDCGMVGIYPTVTEPMRGFVQRMREVERQPGVLSVSLAHGFPWGDAPSMGARMLVISDGDPLLARGLVEELGRKLYEIRREVTLRPLPMGDALDLALAPEAHPKPFVLADVADNAGGGAASDSTFLIRELLERKVENSAVALLWDPIAVQQAFAAGEGAKLRVRLGGKMGPASGEPLDLSVRVRALVTNLVQRWPQTTGYIEVPCGECACFECEGLDIVVGSVREQVRGLEVFTAFGIEPSERDLLVVKSQVHFHAAFGSVAGRVLYVSTPGALSFDFASIPYQYTDVSTKYPFVDELILDA